MATFEEQYEHMIKKQLAEMLGQYIEAQKKAAQMPPSEAQVQQPYGRGSQPKLSTEQDTAVTEHTLQEVDQAGMQVALPREYQMVARPGHAPKQTLAQQIAEFNTVPKAYAVTFDMSALTVTDNLADEELT